jgi:hypothetical protein
MCSLGVCILQFSFVEVRGSPFLVLDRFNYKLLSQENHQRYWHSHLAITRVVQ